MFLHPDLRTRTNHGVHMTKVLKGQGGFDATADEDGSMSSGGGGRKEQGPC